MSEVVSLPCDGEIKNPGVSTSSEVEKECVVCTAGSVDHINLEMNKGIILRRRVLPQEAAMSDKLLP